MQTMLIRCPKCGDLRGYTESVFMTIPNGDIPYIIKEDSAAQVAHGEYFFKCWNTKCESSFEISVNFKERRG